jgi:hypothetical protein
LHRKNAKKWPILEQIIATIVTEQAQAAIKNIANLIVSGVTPFAPDWQNSLYPSKLIGYLIYLNLLLN